MFNPPNFNKNIYFWTLFDWKKILLSFELISWLTYYNHLKLYMIIFEKIMQSIEFFSWFTFLAILKLSAFNSSNFNRIIHFCTFCLFICELSIEKNIDFYELCHSVIDKCCKEFTYTADQRYASIIIRVTFRSFVFKCWANETTQPVFWH